MKFAVMKFAYVCLWGANWQLEILISSSLAACPIKNLREDASMSETKTDDPHLCHICNSETY